jgi:hypothetical protein
MTRSTLAASGAALAYLVLLLIHLTHGTFDERLTTTVDYLNDLAFAAGLVLGAVVLIGLHREAGAPRAATAIGAFGQLLVFSGVAAGLLTGESPEWFVVVGVPGNLLWFGAMIALAVWVWRSEALPRWSAVLMVLTVPMGVAFAEFGGTIVPAALWITVALHLRQAEALVPATAGR